MIRITTNGALINYKASLALSSNSLSTARTKVLTQRNFNSYAEDPAAATQAFSLRRSFSRIGNQLSNTNTLIKKYQSAYSVMNTVKSDLTQESSKVSTLSAINGSTGSGRQPLAEVLKGSAESIVQTMNSQYGTSFIFSGNDALKDAPFALQTDVGGTAYLTYRGVKVDAADGSADLATLKSMNAETSYVDVGSGLTETDDGSLVSSSAFNAALSGIEYLGYGLDDDGDPKNVVSIINQLSAIFSRCDAGSGNYASDDDGKDAERLAGKLEDALDTVTNKWTSLAGKSTYLESSAARLTSASDNLNSQILEVEQVKLADAITGFSWAQYCYNAALKVGNSILSQSLIDYMR